MAKIRKDSIVLCFIFAYFCFQKKMRNGKSRLLINAIENTNKNISWLSYFREFFLLSLANVLFEMIYNLYLQVPAEKILNFHVS